MMTGQAVVCPECLEEMTPRVETRIEAVPVRGENVDVEARCARCSQCGADIWVDELDDATLAAAFDVYRQRHGLMAPEEMRALRKRYGLGSRPFSLLLGWGEITLHRYESGSLQDDAHEAQLRLAQNPENIRVLLGVMGHKLTARQRARVEAGLRHASEPADVSAIAEDRSEYAAGTESTSPTQEVLADQMKDVRNTLG